MVDVVSEGIPVQDVEEFTEKYKNRRKQQMMRFIGSTAVTLISCRLAITRAKARHYVPNMFQLNYKPPVVTYKGETGPALVLATGITVGTLSMLVSGSCWIWDISTMKEFREIKGFSSEKVEHPRLANMPLESDSMRNVYERLELLNGKK
ncbi:hypothetical protein Kpol_479p22 [Vanderwaltozyma polyspora DSM 70294]|uniref:Altered inheritance of mitochondria protein 11 n=1 Tax=Vanderwaltozyma polyspora (strain ATCC 22028 / DSM 70294 / BCRC 21397 / CBS 2163 / NBRC 10782 / NRRL Y-8283 / UCD 57-17) TaxID=436907 RepID=AIM11_VANPO|nr:uncharacterized protein Kpol_479p22 [Vanderwaltozyma polyspora DSM 70294]A7TQD5.1 RecName: Full=Altered inheritance of mitochondria protein 11 [Vanderwaltozyma polyspora DSM 70294]EDO15534.1 hypothetical protein Kpol_479p22 [Vanderwaltozyma polyspora DSM 70294]